MGETVIAAAPLLGKLAVAEGASLFSRWTGGRAEDAARAARAEYFTNAALRGSVQAARCILGGLATVASNERPMYETAEQAVESTRPEVMEAAREIGPVWNLSDTAQNYPVMRGLVESELANATTTGAADPTATQLAPMVTTATAPIATSSRTSNLLLYAVIGVVILVGLVALAMRKK
ncbi:MAG TPA: hypothetical protein VI231_22280 [Candidatus Binatia bacterium]